MSRKPITIIIVSLLLLIGAVAFGFWKTGTENQSAEAAATRTGLVGWWTMDANDKNGTTYYDKSGYGKNMTSNGTLSFLSGKINQSIYFNTIGEWLKYTGNLGISGDSALTLSAWIRPDVLSGSVASVFGMMGGTSDAGITAAIITTNGNVSFSTGNCSEITANNTLTIGKWYHVVATKTPGLMSTTAKIYVDGVSQSLSNQYGDCTPNFTTTKVMVGDGWWSADTIYPFYGSVDDVRIYNRALSAQEVAQLYNSAKTSYSQSPQRASSTPASGGKLIGWWTMDTNDMSSTGATHYDKSGQGNHGTVTGTTTSTGRIGQARNFNGTSDYIEATSFTPNVSENGAASISGWYKFDQTASQKGASMGLHTQIYQHTSNNYFYLPNGADYFNVASVIKTGVWHHIVLTYNGNHSTAILYIDNVRYSVALQTTSDTSAMSSFIIGDSVGLITTFDGQIDDVRVYNYVLSQQEVANLYNASKQSYVGATVRRTGLVLDLNFGNNDAQAAPKVYDTSGFGRHATSTAGATSPTCNNSYCSFDGGDYVTANATGAFNSSNFSFAIKFTPTWSPGDGTQRYFFEANGGTKLLIDDAGGLRVTFGDTQLTTITVDSYIAYWKKDKENILVATGTSGSNGVWLNGTKISSVSTAWSSAQSTNIIMGCRLVKTNLYTGKIHYLKVWNRLLTDAEVGILSADRQTNVK